MSDEESDAESTVRGPDSHDHSLWTHLVQAGSTTADMTTDVAAIIAIAWMAVSGVDPATLQVTGAMVCSVAIGKRWMASKAGGPSGQ